MTKIFKKKANHDYYLVTWEEFIQCSLGTFSGGNVDEFLQRVDDMSANQYKSAKIPTIMTSDGDRWAVQLILRELLEIVNT